MIYSMTEGVRHRRLCSLIFRSVSVCFSGVCMQSHFQQFVCFSDDRAREVYVQSHFFTVCVSVLVLTEAEKMCMCKLIFSCLFQWWLRCGCLCNLILDKIQTHTIFKRTPIYYDADIQSARFGGNPLCRATKWLKTTVKWLKMTRNEMRKINILYCCLSVIFWLDKGAFPESLQIVSVS